MQAVIICDVLAEKAKSDGESVAPMADLTGRVFGKESGTTLDYTFRLIDDDSIVYYVGKADSLDMIEWMHEWSQNDSGTTSTELLNSFGKWDAFIG